MALKIFEVIEREKLADNARKLGAWMQAELDRLAKNYPAVVKRSRGIGFMLGLELAENIPAFAASDKSAAIQFVNRLHAAGVLTIPAGTQIVRLLPPLNLKPQEAGEGIAKIEEVVEIARMTAAARKHLSAVDPVMRKLIREHGACKLEHGNPGARRFNRWCWRWRTSSSTARRQTTFWRGSKNSFPAGNFRKPGRFGESHRRTNPRVRIFLRQNPGHPRHRGKNL